MKCGGWVTLTSLCERLSPLVDTTTVTSCTCTSPGGPRERECGGTGSVRHEVVLERLRAERTTDQRGVRKKLDIDGREGGSSPFRGRTRLAGVDMFAKDNAVDACIALIVLESPSMKVVHKVPKWCPWVCRSFQGFSCMGTVCCTRAGLEVRRI